MRVDFYRLDEVIGSIRLEDGALIADSSVEHVLESEIYVQGTYSAVKTPSAFLENLYLYYRSPYFYATKMQEGDAVKGTKHLPGEHDQQDHAHGKLLAVENIEEGVGEQTLSYKDFSKWKGLRKKIANLALFDIQTNKFAGIIGRSEDGKVVSIVSLMGVGKGSSIEVVDFATGEPGYGRKMMAAICAVASKHKQGITLTSTEEAYGFYEKIGMTDAGMNVSLKKYEFTKEQAKKFAKDNADTKAKDEEPANGVFAVRVKATKHLPGQHDQSTHGHGTGSLSGVNVSKWSMNNSSAKSSAKKIDTLEKLAEAEDWTEILKVASSQPPKGANTYQKGVIQAAKNLLAHKNNVVVAQAPAKDLKTNNGLVDASQWKQVGPKLGTQPGGKFVGEDGKEYYVKYPENPDVARNEVIANKLYEMTGAGVPKAHLVEGPDGKVGVATEWDNNAQKANWGDASTRELAAKDFATHAWLANWDCVGAGSENPMDNIRISNGKAVSVDVGGSLAYSGLGGSKPFGKISNEWDTLRDTSVNPSSAKVFSKMTKEQLIESSEKMNMVTRAGIEAIVETYHAGGADNYMKKQNLIDTLMYRRFDVLTRGENLKKQIAEKPAPPTTITKPDGSSAISKPVPATIPPMVMLGSGNNGSLKSAQNTANKMHELASQGKWAELEAMKTNPDSKSHYYKKVHQFKQDLLAAKNGGAVVDTKPPATPKPAVTPKPANTPTINTAAFPTKPTFSSTNLTQVSVNNAAVEKALEHAKNGDVFALKNMTLPGSPKLAAWHGSLVENVASQMNPPPPARQLSGSLSEIANKAKVVVGKDLPTKVGKFLVLGEASPIPTDAVQPKQIRAEWEKGKDSYNKLNNAEKEAIKDYTGGSFYSMNHQLRNFKKLTPDTESACSALKKASIPLPVGMKLSRGIPVSGVEVENLRNSVGKVLQDRGIISTSTGSGFSGNVKMTFVAGPGAKGLPAKRFSHVTSENEYILPPNSRFLVTEAADKNGTLHVTMTILPFEDSQCCPP